MLAGPQTVSASDAKPATALEGLSSEDYDTRMGVVREILAQREALVRELIARVDPANSGTYNYQAEAAAAYLLGEMRAAEAAPVIAKALAEIPVPEVSADYDPLAAPFFSALVKIGRPSVPPMIEIIESTDDKNVRRQAVMIVIHVLGGDRHMFELLDKLKARSADAEKTKRIETTIEWAREYLKKGEAKEPLY